MWLADGREPPLLLDVRRREAFVSIPFGLPGAKPVVMEDIHLRWPEMPSDALVVIYCLCDQETSSYRAALFLLAAGFKRVCVLEGGIGAWHAAGAQMVSIAVQGDEQTPVVLAEKELSSTPAWKRLFDGDAILRGAVLGGESLPTERKLAVLFVDMVDSAQMLAHHNSGAALARMQAFWLVIVECAQSFCGELHDFEGDGAFLYFSGPGEALSAAIAMQRRLALLEREPLIRARYALDYGLVTVGEVGGRFRRGVCFVGVPVIAAARMLRLCRPDQIAATTRFVEKARVTAPDLAVHFTESMPNQTLRGLLEPVDVVLSKLGDFRVS